MRIHYYSMEWRDGLKNLGDFITCLIAKRLGFSVQTPERGKRVLFGDGSTLGSGHLGLYPPSTVVVWGAGLMYKGDAEKTLSYSASFRAVRSELTRDLLGLPKSTPLGYPALLVPDLLELPEVESPGTLFVGHCGDDLQTPPGFDSAVSMRVHEDHALELIARISKASFVASASMHGCILASAFDVPWAPVVLRKDRDLQWKWTEWSHFLGITPIERAVEPDLESARRWWQTVGYKGKMCDLKPLLESFPRDLEES